MNFDLQSIVVYILIAAACAYGGMWLKRKAGSFSKKPDCGTDCGCGETSNREDDRG